MNRRRRGQALVEFALCFPIVALMFVAPIQLQRLWYRQFTLERLSFDVARALGAANGTEATLAALAATLVGADTTVSVRVRDLQAPILASPRRLQRWQVVDVDLSRESGVSFPLLPSPLCRAHARELRLDGGAA